MNITEKRVVLTRSTVIKKILTVHMMATHIIAIIIIRTMKINTIMKIEMSIINITTMMKEMRTIIEDIDLNLIIITIKAPIRVIVILHLWYL